jgi:hypothetical protein
MITLTCYDDPPAEAVHSLDRNAGSQTHRQLPTLHGKGRRNADVPGVIRGCRTLLACATLHMLKSTPGPARHGIPSKGSTCR